MAGSPTSAHEHASWPERWRERFPILAETNYLVSHSLGAMPRAARAKLEGFCDQWATRGVRAWAEGWWSAPVDVGNLVGRLIGAPENTVAMHQNVSVIQSIVASCLDFTKGRDKVVLVDQEFPTVMYVWERMRELGARIEIVESEGHELPLERLLAAIDERTAIVPTSIVLYKSHFLQDAAAIQRRAREVGALCLFDAYQALGTVPIDVRAADLDMLCGGSVKWLCGGPGAAYLYVRPELLAQLRPRVTGWMAHAAPFDFDPPPQRYAEGAWRLLHGSPAVACLLQASAGYETILEVGVDAIRAWSLRLTEGLRADLAERGFGLNSPADPARRGGTLTVALAPDEDGPAFVRALERRSILVDHRPGAGLRVSPHFYTREDELRELAAALSELRATKRWREHVSAGSAY